MAMNDDSRTYWATAPVTEIADKALDRVDRYYKYLSMTGRMDLYRRSWAYFYRPRITGARLNPTGEQGELTALSVNHYRNLLSHLEVLTTQQKPAWEPQATNTDVKSQAQVILATGLLDYYMREKRLERYIKRTVKGGLMFGEAFLRCEWDASGGKMYGKTGTGATIYEGDIKYSVYTPLNCIRDFTLESPAQSEWEILRDTVNKFTLASKFPELSNEILDDSVDLLEYAATTTLQALGLDDSDNIFMYTLLHKPTPALPNGRFTTFLDNGTVLLDGPLPYREKTHVYRLAPDEEEGTIFGYTVGFDLLAVQEGIDVLYSSAISNACAFAVQNILVPKGHDLSTNQIAGGLNLMEYDPAIGKPEGMTLLATSPEVYSFITMLEHVQETLSGVNSVTRGNPEASLKSGAALALVQSMAIQFSMNLQQSYAAIIEDGGTGTIQILQDFAAVPQVAAIAGKSKRPLMKEFTGKDLDKINRVMVDMGNPLTQTTAGKVNLADALAEKNMIDNADQYVQVLTTGRVDPVVEGKQAQNLLIKSENEMLSNGQAQTVLKTDHHQKHLLEHQVVLANPEIRADPNNPIAVATTEHMAEHIAMLQRPDVQQLMAILHQEATPPMPGPPAPNPGADPGQAAAPALPGNPAGNLPNMPSLPGPPQGADAQSANIINAQKGQLQ